MNTSCRSTFIRPTIALLLSVVLVAPWASAQVPARVAPLYRLPAAGTWVDYSWMAGQEGLTRKGTLRISLVGETKVLGVACCWIELKRHSGDGGKTNLLVCKVLVEKKAVLSGSPLEGHVLEGYEQQGDAAPAKRVSRRRLEAFFNLGFEGPVGALNAADEKVAVETALDKLLAQHVSAAGRCGAGCSNTTRG
jgi:hypothetical protein